jgi:uncharacterized protein
MNYQAIATHVGLPIKAVSKTIELLLQGATIPFLARYRKEATGGLDEVQLEAIKLAYEQEIELEKRRTFILKSIEEQAKLTPALEAQIKAATNLTDLEDLYLPYRKKKNTRATLAKEKGLEPLALRLFQGQLVNPRQEAQKYVKAEVPTVEEALQGARDIVAEWINEDAEVRGRLRAQFLKQAVVRSTVKKGKTEEGANYADYFDFTQDLTKIPSHRFLAIRRAEEEGILQVRVETDDERALQLMERQFSKGLQDNKAQLTLAIADAFKRLLKPSLDTEVLNIAKLRADEEAIRIFASNVRELLLSSPLGPKRILAIDPGFRTGCKTVVLDEQGKLLHNTVLYPLDQKQQAAQRLDQLLTAYSVQAIAIGNGTAGRETTAFVQDFLAQHPLKNSISVHQVSEQGASIYSASEVARAEFPDKDVTVRGAVSIGRRLLDPLAELVKIDPKSIGVGQYQHDVDQKKLKESLDTVVLSCVNQVGVNLNTASEYLLRYVSGLGPALAASIVAYRNENGAFTQRSQLLKVPRLGAKAYEQCAGFLRIPNAPNPLDASAVHPESYGIVEKIAGSLGKKVTDLMGNTALRSSLDLSAFTSEKVGLPTLTDILSELEKPGRDPRAPLASVQFDDQIRQITDLREGMIVTGVVSNLAAFGAFVDLGIKQAGLLHISEMANRFIKNPAEVVKLNQTVQVKVLEVDLARNRISLSLKL